LGRELETLLGLSSWLILVWYSHGTLDELD